MNILIVEDEARIAKRIERMTVDILGGSLQSIAHVDALPAALDYIKNKPLDLMLLDLNLNGANGFDLLVSAVSGSFHTIIISAYKEQAITAFEHGVLDFVPKPFNRDRLQHALSRIAANHPSDNHPVRQLAIRKKGKIQLVLIDDLMYIKGAGTYSELYLANGTRELHDKSLERLEQLLHNSFVRIHKSYLVKSSEIREIKVKSGSKYLAVLNNGELLPVGRTRYKEIKANWL